MHSDFSLKNNADVHIFLLFLGRQNKKLAIYEIQLTRLPEIRNKALRSSPKGEFSGHG